MARTIAGDERFLEQLSVLSPAASSGSHRWASGRTASFSSSGCRGTDGFFAVDRPLWPARPARAYFRYRSCRFDPVPPQRGNAADDLHRPPNRRCPKPVHAARGLGAAGLRCCRFSRSPRAPPPMRRPTCCSPEGRVLDGTGAEPIVADVAVTGDRIVFVGNAGEAASVGGRHDRCGRSGGDAWVHRHALPCGARNRPRP